MTPMQVLVENQIPSAELEKKIRDRTARVGVIGLGYVGLPLAVEFAAAGFTVTGIEVQATKVAQLNGGTSYIQDVSQDIIRPLVENGKLAATTDFSVIRDLDTLNICVPTPLRKTKDPDMSYIVSACDDIARYLKPGTLVILESTTYPGTTDEIVLSALESTGLKVGQDFFLCFSPERVDQATRTIRRKIFQRLLVESLRLARTSAPFSTSKPLRLSFLSDQLESQRW